MPTNDFKVDFIGIGDANAATSWIFQCLIEHPGICGSEIKETHFFERERLYKKGLRFYKSFFDHCPKDKVIGEFSPGYIRYPDAAQRIKKYFPNVKLILCLRNPIEKLYSHYWYDKIGGSGTTVIYKTFEDAVWENPKFAEKNLCYEKVRRIFNSFPEENILVLIYEDIKKDPVRFIQCIYKFLGIAEDFIPLSVNKRINVSEGAKHRFLLLYWIPVKIYRFLENYPVFQTFFKKHRELVLKMLYIMHKINTKPTDRKYERPPMNAKTKEYLQGIYRDDTKKLEELLNRDLSFWR